MSLTTRPCPHCGDGVFADDDHSCVYDGRAVQHPNHLPSGGHYAILLFRDQGLSYILYTTEDAWKAGITELLDMDPDAKYVALRSVPAKVKRTISVSVEVD